MPGQYGERQKVDTTQRNIWKFEKKGDHIEGVYSGETQLNPQYPPLYIIGEQLVPQKKQLETAFKRIPIGSYVWITFDGLEKIKGGKTINNFTVESALPKGSSNPNDEEVPF